MKSLAECRLYTFIDTAYLHGREPAAIARELCAGGSDVIQLRAKKLADKEIILLAKKVLPITEAAGVPLVINDHPHIAREVGARFVHLGQEDFFEAGLTHGGDQRLGLSSHSPAQAERAIAAGAAYIAIGPVYATGTKPGATPVTLGYVHWAAAHVRIPWFAIGGITLDNLDEVLAVGARRICVVSAILNSPDLARTCQMFKQRLSSAALK
jgi:thiamine-phosphate pyrophosphorylase